MGNDCEWPIVADCTNKRYGRCHLMKYDSKMDALKEERWRTVWRVKDHQRGSPPHCQAQCYQDCGSKTSPSFEGCREDWVLRGSQSLERVTRWSISQGRSQWQTSFAEEELWLLVDEVGGYLEMKEKAGMRVEWGRGETFWGKGWSGRQWLPKAMTMKKLSYVMWGFVKWGK